MYCLKRIIFYDLGKENYWLVLMIFSLILIGTGIFKPFDLENKNPYNYFFVGGFVLQVLYYSILFWFRNTILFNKKGIVIRINSFFGKSLRFDEITTAEFNEKILTLSNTNGHQIKIDLSEFSDADSRKLFEIMIHNSGIKK